MQSILLFLQTTDTSSTSVPPIKDILEATQPNVDAVVNHTQTLSLLSLLEQGGVIMYPLYFLFILVIFIFLQKLIVILRENKNYNFSFNLIKEQILSGNIILAIDTAEKMNNSIGRVLIKGIQRKDKPIYNIERSMENAAKLEIFRLEKNLNILSIIAGIAPMFGFLGTIVGMVQLFYAISATGEYTLNTIAGGIYVKMITSATGLIIGLLAYIGYNFLSSQIDRKINQLEVVSAEFMDVIQTK